MPQQNSTIEDMIL